MLDALNAFFLNLGDPLLGWLLYLPRDAALLILALSTSLIVALVRPWTTNQDLLRRCAEDKRRLKERIREAKRAKDKETVSRCQTCIGRIGMKTMRQEGWPLLASLLPIVILATWAFGRIAYLPQQADEPVAVKMFFPTAAIGEVVHLVPQPGLAPAEGWIRYVGEDHDANGTVSAGRAEWKVTAARRAEPYLLRFRCQGRTYEKEFLSDGLRYTQPISFYGTQPAEVFQLGLAAYRPFGVLPGVPALALDPWVLGYLLVVIPLAFLIKRVLRVY